MTALVARLLGWAGLKNASPAAALAAVLLVAIAAVNVAQFALVEQNSTRMTRAFFRFESDDIFELSIPYAGNERSRYAVYVALAQLAPESEYVTVRADGGFRGEFVRRIVGFGSAASVQSVVGDPRDVLANAAIDGHVVATGEAGFRGPAFVIAIAGRDVDVPPADYVDAVLAAGRSESPTGQPERFVVVELPLPGSTANDKAIWYFIDASLIDDPAVAGWFE